MNLAQEKLSASIKHFKCIKRSLHKDPAPLYYQAIIYQRLAAPHKAAGKFSEILDNFENSPFAIKENSLISIRNENPELREQIQITLDGLRKRQSSDCDLVLDMVKQAMSEKKQLQRVKTLQSLMKLLKTQMEIKPTRAKKTKELRLGSY